MILISKDAQKAKAMNWGIQMHKRLLNFNKYKDIRTTEASKIELIYLENEKRIGLLYKPWLLFLCDDSDIFSENM